MKYCTRCGAQMQDDATFCTTCGQADNVGQPIASGANQNQSYNQAPVSTGNSGLTTAAKVFMILGTVFMGIYIIPLAWCIPMTVSYCNKVKNNLPISTGFKVCSLLFVSLLGGIFMLCDKDH